MRAVSDEPDFDVEVTQGKSSSSKASVTGFQVASKGQRVIGTHAYVYGESVKPPGPRGELDPAAVAQLQALLKGTP